MIALRPDEERFLSRRELSRRWDCSESSISRLEKRGTLTAVVLPIENSVRYRLSEILALENDGN